MARKKARARIIIHLKSSASPHMYSTYKNKKNSPEKISVKKFDPVVRKHVLYKETR